MKKFLALLLAVMMLSVAAFALAEEAGFDEYELGVEGEQDVDFMTMSMVYFQPVDMAPAENATPKEGSDLHIEVDLTANENPYSFPVDGWVPYLSIDFVIKDTDSNEVYSGSMMPMAASDGPHYGANIKLPEADTYNITFTIHSPEDMNYLIHSDAETGPGGVLSDYFANGPLTVTYEGWDYTPQEW